MTVRQVEILGGPHDGLVIRVHEWQIFAGRVLFHLKGQSTAWWMPLVERDRKLKVLWQESSAKH